MLIKDQILFPDNPLLDEPSHEPIPERPLLPPLPQIHSTYMAEQIDEIIDDLIISTRDCGFHRFLIRWKGLPDFDNICNNQEELQQLSPDRLEHYESQGVPVRHSRVFPNLGGMMGTSLQDCNFIPGVIVTLFQFGSIRT